MAVRLRQPFLFSLPHKLPQLASTAHEIYSRRQGRYINLNLSYAGGGGGKADGAGYSHRLHAHAIIDHYVA